MWQTLTWWRTTCLSSNMASYCDPKFYTWYYTWYVPIKYFDFRNNILLFWLCLKMCVMGNQTSAQSFRITSQISVNVYAKVLQRNAWKKILHHDPSCIKWVCKSSHRQTEEWSSALTNISVKLFSFLFSQWLHAYKTLLMEMCGLKIAPSKNSSFCSTLRSNHLLIKTFFFSPTVLNIILTVIFF